MDIFAIEKDFTGREQGEWVSNIPNLGEVQLYVKGLNSDDVRDFMAKQEKAIPVNRREDDGSINAETRKKILKDALIEVVLLDWKGFTLKGEELLYSKETARQYIENPNFELFADAVVYAASIVDKGKSLSKEDTEKKPK